MRGILISAVMLGIGVTAGVLRTSAEFSGMNERFVPNNGTGSSGRERQMAVAAADHQKGIAATAGAKALVLNGETHNFGTMEKGSKGQFEFQLKNVGTATLKLQSGGTSCAACTISKLSTDTLAPNETATILINWETLSPDPEFRKEAYIHTSDPDRPLVLLVIKGSVIRSVQVDPEEFTLGNVTSSEPTVVRARILLSTKREMKITGVEWSAPDRENRYEAQVRPLDPADLPKDRTVYHSGHEVIVTLKPGLPLGNLQQTIRLKTDWEETPELEIPLRGTVVSDISFVGGKSFEPRNNTVSLGLVKQGQTAKVSLPMLLKGPHRKDVEVKVGAITPSEAIQVTLGEPKLINDGAVVMRMVNIEVRADSPPVNLMGGPDEKQYGKVFLETTHPEAKQIKLLVRFAVESVESK